MLRFCGWMLALSLVAVPVLSAAEEADMDDLSTDVTSLNYYPHQGYYYLFPKDTQSIDQHSSRSTGTKSSTNENSIALTYVHGFGGGFRAGFTESMLLNSQQTSTAADGSQTSSMSYGYSDPTLMWAWRFYAPEDSDWSADIGGNVIPSVGHKLTETTNQNGNDLNGFWEALVRAELFGRFGKNETGAEILFTQDFTGHSDAPAASNTSTTAARLITSGTLTDRYHFNADWFLEGALLLTEPFPVHAAFADGTTQTTTNTFHMDPQMTLGWRPRETNLLTVTYTLRHYAQTVTSSASGQNSVDLVNVNIVAGYLLEF